MRSDAMQLAEVTAMDAYAPCIGCFCHSQLTTRNHYLFIIFNKTWPLLHYNLIFCRLLVDLISCQSKVSPSFFFLLQIKLVYLYYWVPQSVASTISIPYESDKAANSPIYKDRNMIAPAQVCPYKICTH
jgi:hypothetical protein